MQRTDLRLQLPDLKCAGCTERVETVLERLDGVQSAGADLDAKEAAVTYDAETVAPEELVEAVEQAGYSPSRS
jgi:Cu+-exporting ATPase